MEKKNLQILIIDDDVSFGKSIEELLNRTGYSAQWFLDVEQATKSFSYKSYHVALIDGMLPKVSGLDLAKQFYKESKQELKIIFMSGIFKDKQFINKAKKSVNALGFLTKPFEHTELLNLINNAFNSFLGPLNSFQRMYQDQNLTKHEAIDVINSDTHFHGFDLPFIFNLLSHYKGSGELKINYSNKKQYTISFHNGLVSNIQSKDLDSFFGVLLVEYGYSELENVKSCLKNKSKSKKRIGQRLIDANALSPHAVDIIYKKQLQIRISQSLQNESAHLVFKEDEGVEHSNVQLTEHELPLQTAEWVLTKVSTEWLESFFNSWLSHKISLGYNHNKMDSFLNLSIIENKQIFKSISPHSITFEELLDKNKENKYEFLFGFYYLLINSVFNFTPHSTSSLNDDGVLGKLQGIEKSHREQDHFQVLGIGPQAENLSIQKAYQDLAKSLHPDKFSDYSEEIVELAHKIFSKISDAYNCLKDSKKRAEYVRNQQTEKYEQALHSEMLLDKSVSLLKRRKFAEALLLLEKIKTLDSKPAMFDLYHIWSHLKIGPKNSKYEEFHQKMHSWIQQIPQEDRHNPLYFFIKGLFYASTGYHQKSFENFQKSLALDANFIEARREMLKLQGTKTKSQDKTQLTKVFSHIFKFKS